MFESNLDTLVNEIVDCGIEGQKYDLQNIMNNPKKAEVLLLLAEAINKQNDLVEDVQQELGDTVIVQLGNVSDTDGSTLAKGEIIKIELVGALNQPLYYIATPKGIALAGKWATKNNHFYSTHCMPLSYAKWILVNWQIEVEDHAVAITNSVIIKDNIYSPDIMREAIKEAISLQN